MSTDTETLAAQVRAMQAAMKAKAPAPRLATFAADQQRMEREGVPEGVAAPGIPMPDGALLDVDGNDTTLAAARAGGPAVVVFYRGAWCPYCNLALRAYEQALVPSLNESGVALIAISPQKPDGTLSIAERNGLTYTVLSDPGNSIAGALGIVTEVSPEARGAQAETGVDVATTNADGTYGIPMPTVVVVDADGVIGWIDVHPNYATRSEPADILAAVGEL